jgi:hypothetical protein
MSPPPLQQPPPPPRSPQRTAYPPPEGYLTGTGGGFGRHFSALATCQRLLQEEQQQQQQLQQQLHPQPQVLQHPTLNPPPLDPVLPQLSTLTPHL